MPKRHDFKLIVIGDMGCGKSCIINRLINGEFHEKMPQTMGVAYASITCDVEGQQTRLQLWDTAGQERFKSVTSVYYRGAVGVFLVFDLTEKDSFDHLEGWLDDVRKYNDNPDTVITLLGNKADLEEERKIDKEAAEKWAEQHEALYFETSAATGANIDEAFKETARQVAIRLKDGRIPWSLVGGQSNLAKKDKIDNVVWSKGGGEEKKKGCC
eukprot:TRINITY_DN67905_c9_g3_i1.p1 TRINITY_DN67905_c9_g3~~TRINITY_DN67905_c9_g3_i1.p1  ORF type:complete len:213 (-),score=20.57 TRINITY_DN67905_c9_g3_i1:853-1491(-)